jgi:glycosyltransferase involved in cell wall biosynthesis
MPTVSVIVPNYNYARFLPKRVESVLRQTYKDIEVILLDDCSTDDSRAVLSKYAAADPRVVRLEFNEVNSGSTFKQWNKGMGFARGKYVWIAEADDYADEHLLERLVSIIEADPSVAFAYCRAWAVMDGVPNGFVDRFNSDLSAHRWAEDYLTTGIEECRNYLAQRNTITNTSGVVFRRATYEQAGGADESLRLCGDWKMWAAMALTGKIAFVAQPLNYLRFHDSTVRNKSIAGALETAEALHVIRWILERVAPEPEVLERIRERQAGCWVPALMSLRVPLARKRMIFRDARSIDPHPMRRALGPAFATIQRKLARHLRPRRSAPNPVA